MSIEKLAFRVVEETAIYGARRSLRSTAVCEQEPGHDDPLHIGRTRGGYWKSWPVEAGSASGSTTE